MLGADRMARVHAQPSFDPDQHEAVCERELPPVELDVVIGAEAEYVLQHVRPLVRPTERADVRGLRIGAGRGVELDPADLAVIAVEPLHRSRHRGITDDAGYHNVATSSWLVQGSLLAYAIGERPCRRQLLQPEAPYQEAVASRSRPEVIDAVEPVVAIA